MPAMASRSVRRKRAAESFKTASECIGAVEPGMALFALTRGQFSMVDAIMAVLDQVGPADVSVWTWTIAEYEVDEFDRLRTDGRIKKGTLVIDHGARGKNAALIRKWKESFGSNSVRYVLNHAKVATVEGSGLRVLLRGSMNLNYNPRFEQLDVTEGGGDFDLIREVEEGLPVLADDCSGQQVYAASKVRDAWDSGQLSLFQGCKVWAK